MGGFWYYIEDKKFVFSDIEVSLGVGYSGDGNFEIFGIEVKSFFYGGRGGMYFYYELKNGGFGGGGYGMIYGGGGGGYLGGGVIGIKMFGVFGGGGLYNFGFF